MLPCSLTEMFLVFSRYLNLDLWGKANKHMKSHGLGNYYWNLRLAVTTSFALNTYKDTFNTAAVKNQDLTLASIRVL